MNTNKVSETACRTCGLELEWASRPDASMPKAYAVGKNVFGHIRSALANSMQDPRDEHGWVKYCAEHIGAAVEAAKEAKANA
jgi:hypothetical protein